MFGSIACAAEIDISYLILDDLEVVKQNVDKAIAVYHTDISYKESDTVLDMVKDAAEKVMAYDFIRNCYPWMSFAQYYEAIVQRLARAAREAARRVAGDEINGAALLDDIFNFRRDVAVNPALVGMTLEQKQAADVSLLNFSPRATRALADAGITTIGSLIANSREDLLRHWNFGRKSLNEVVVQLGKIGLTLLGE